MNTKWLVLLIPAAALFAMAGLYRAVRAGRCEMTCTNGYVFDWGIVDEDASVEHGFIIKNEGKSDLVIRRLQPGCGCAEADISKERLAPSETATLRIRYTARRVPDREYIGVRVISNDEATPVKEFVMTGVVRLALSCRPRSLSFDLSAEEEVLSQTLHFQTNLGTCELLKWSAPDSLVLEWDTKGRMYVCSVKPRPGFSGPVNQEIAAEFKVDGNVKNITVPVYVLH